MGAEVASSDSPRHCLGLRSLRRTLSFDPIFIFSLSLSTPRLCLPSFLCPPAPQGKRQRYVCRSHGVRVASWGKRKVDSTSAYLCTVVLPGPGNNLWNLRRKTQTILSWWDILERTLPGTDEPACNSLLSNWVTLYKSPHHANASVFPSVK